MTTFAYRAADRHGRTREGVMDAPDARTVVERLRQDACFPIRIAPHEDRAAPRAWALLPTRRVRGRDLVAFTQELATLVEAGLPLDRALAILGELTPSPRLRAITSRLLEAVRGGASLGDALAEHQPRPFSRLYVNMVRAGEKGGVLDTTLKRLAEYLEEAQALRETLTSALIYPALLATVGAGAVVFLMTFVIPRFADIFRDLGGAIPLPTQVLLDVSEVFQRYWWAMGLGALGLALGARMALTVPRVRFAVDGVVLRLPLVGEVVRKGETARFARILGTLLRSGVPLIGALTVVKEMLSSRPLVRAADGLADGVRRGAGLCQPMAAARVFPPLAVHMVRVGEETGRLEEMLLKVGAVLEADTRRRLARVVALAEPVIILVLGLLVGFIVLAMLMAIFSISELPL
ncbi:MAG TPA: type II secretion system F family protein [Methylomirabilota bacterium]|nr:type II secretion system F family protein [Methylomirabilota bacterium]